MAQKRYSMSKTATRMIKDVFINHQALSPDTAIGIEEFKDLRLTTELISYTIANLMEDNIIMKTGDDRFYFSQEDWKKLEKKVGKAYWILLGSPLIVMFLVMFLRYGFDLTKIFFK